MWTVDDYKNWYYAQLRTFDPSDEQPHWVRARFLNALKPPKHPTRVFFADGEVDLAPEVPYHPDHAIVWDEETANALAALFVLVHYELLPHP